MSNNFKYDSFNNFFNRELSWLEFNQRVIDEANDTSNPLFERLKFLAISSSNLDEFFMVRVGSIYNQMDVGFEDKELSGLTPSEQIDKILFKVNNMVQDQYAIYNKLYDYLGSMDLKIYKHNMLNEEQLQYIDDYYKNVIYPILTPMVIDSGRPFPLLLSKTLNIGAILKGNYGDEVLGTIQVPSVLDRIVPLPGKNNFILLEDIIKSKLNDLFGFEVLSSTCYRITKNAEFNIDEEDAEDLLETIRESLKQRRFGVAIRLEMEETEDFRVLNLLKEELDITSSQVFFANGPIDLTFLMKLYSIEGFKDHKFAQNKSLPIPQLQNSNINIFDAISRKDILLHHPYESFSAIVKLIEEAAEDPKVLAIKQTLYRVSGNSPIIAALLRAAENGKQVTVLVELKARFDEENNIHWARKLEKAGCHVIYGVIGLKTHSKVLLIVRQERNGLKRYVHFGSGNYNDVTAKFYTDIGVLTASPEFGEDASVIFNMLSGYFKPTNLSKITIAPTGLRKKLISLIRREIRNVNNGSEGRIIAKMNSLVDKELIIELYKASQAGVKIDLIVRGICCLKPDISGLSDNIRVISIVGKYLEHSRIYYFLNNGEDDVYISSADWMFRNLDKRVETMSVVDDSSIKQELKSTLNLYLNDNVKSKILLSNGTYKKFENGKEEINAQEEMYKLTKKFNSK